MGGVAVLKTWQIGVRDLAAAAYARVDLVERRGEFAVRGGIVDVFPPTEDHPLRIAFWGDTVEIDDGAAMTWMRQPHYYMGLYPYTYSIGLIAATALAEKSNRDGDVVLSQWLDVLRAGGTLPPLDLMRQVGIDLASPQPIRDAVAYVGRMIEELEGSF